jgi:hypothetical protein
MLRYFPQHQYVKRRNENKENFFSCNIPRLISIQYTRAGYRGSRRQNYRRPWVQLRQKKLEKDRTPALSMDRMPVTANAERQWKLGTPYANLRLPANATLFRPSIFQVYFRQKSCFRFFGFSARTALHNSKLYLQICGIKIKTEDRYRRSKYIHYVPQKIRQIQGFAPCARFISECVY